MKMSDSTSSYSQTRHSTGTKKKNRSIKSKKLYALKFIKYALMHQKNMQLFMPKKKKKLPACIYMYVFYFYITFFITLKKLNFSLNI